jgi:hypothetical protein
MHGHGYSPFLSCYGFGWRRFQPLSAVGALISKDRFAHLGGAKG